MPGYTSYARFVSAMLCRECCSSIPWIEAGQICCHACGRSIPCNDCIRLPTSELIRNRSAVRYDDGMKELLAQLKYRGDEAVASLLEALMCPAFEHMTSELYRLYCTHKNLAKYHPRELMQLLQRGGPNQAAYVWDALTYVPVSSQRAEERGFNQAQLLAEGLAVRYGLPAIELLNRIRDTPKQSFQSRKARFQNTEALFTPAPDAAHLLNQLSLKRNRQQSTPTNSTIRILIVDDIYTTGSTLRACAKSLSGTVIPVEVYSLAWARG